MALQLFTDSVSSKECMTERHPQSAVIDRYQADVIILMQLNDAPGISTARVISLATESRLHQTERSSVYHKSHAVVVRRPSVVNLEKDLGIDVVEPTLLRY